MIPTSSTLQGESFTATTRKRGDVTIEIHGERGILLAQAIGGRKLPIGYKEGWAVYNFTPARAGKWHLLWQAGFTARPRMIEGVTHWRCDGCGRKNLFRREAVAIARGKVGALVEAAKAL